MFVQAESDAQEKDKQLNDLLVRMSQYEQVRQIVSDCYRLFFSVQIMFMLSMLVSHVCFVCILLSSCIIKLLIGKCLWYAQGIYGLPEAICEIKNLKEQIKDRER